MGIHSLTLLCCSICINMWILGHLLPADLHFAGVQHDAELLLSSVAIPLHPRLWHTSCGLPRCLGEARILLPALPPGQCPCRSALGAGSLGKSQCQGGGASGESSGSFGGHGSSRLPAVPVQAVAVVLGMAHCPS